LIRERAYPLAQAAWEVGSPQIRNRGTVAGNLITASPANDAIPPLMALGATLVLQSKTGSRRVALEDFYTGVRRTVLKADEMLVDIVFRAMTPDQQGAFYKLALRKAQAISVVNTAILVSLSGGKVQSAAITFGSVAPTIIHARLAEEFLIGRSLNEATILQVGELALQAVKPISDVRSSADYRSKMVRVITQRSLRAIAGHAERAAFPQDPILLWGKARPYARTLAAGEALDEQTPIHTTINGKDYTFNTGQSKTLLRLLREEGGLIGTKEGCAEGECGACTVFLDGIAVMGCMVPAPRANGAVIETVEGLAQDGVLHPLQQAFIDKGAVQCGYCTPGFIMSGVKILEEKTGPTSDQIRQAITGNLCRCTGYYKIVEAIEQASGRA
jgi:carbon-monoxide dehydrogenase medium subunit